MLASCLLAFFSLACLSPMAYGLWPTAYGLRPMAYGLWPMAYGLWPMAYGPWHLAPPLPLCFLHNRHFLPRPPDPVETCRMV